MNYYNQITGFRWANEFPRGGRLAQRVRTGGRRQLLSGDVSKMQCGSQVYVNLFFDGTGNHKESDKKTFEQTNIARLYSASRGSEDPVKTEDGWIFKYYIQGVGTPFEEIGETTFSLMGKAFAKGFGNRIGWAYTRLLNAAYAATPKSEKLAYELLPKNDAFSVCKELNINDGKLLKITSMSTDPRPWNYDPQSEEREKRPVLHSKLMTLATVHKEHTTPNIYEKIRKIWINVFGFSRGAAEARVFVNRLINDWAPSGKLAGVIDYKVNFMGLFDTVASVGIPDSARAGFVDLSSLDGHWGWAADGALDVPTSVERCVHFIAIHEQRMSFPLDLIREGPYNYPRYRLETAYPGVHSDVGGGYRPKAQGKAYSEIEGDMSHKLGQITLHDMYDEAVVAGVPMNMGNLLRDEVHDWFDIDDDVVDAYNAWRREMPSVSCAEEAIRLGIAHRLAWQAKRSLPGSGDYITERSFYRNAMEDPLTPYDLNKLNEAEIEELTKKRNNCMTARSRVSGEIDASTCMDDTDSLKPQRTSLDEQIDQLNKQIEDEGPRLEKHAGKEPGSHRPGEGAVELLTNDKTDLREGAEEFRLLMGTLFPEESTSVWACKETTRWHLSWPILEFTLAVQREATRDGQPVYIVLTEEYISLAINGLKNDDTQYDVLVKPAEEVLGFLKEHTNEQARTRVSATMTRLFDDFVHDSRAWFRVPYFHEQEPGGYGWLRVLFQGADDRVAFLDIRA